MARLDSEHSPFKEIFEKDPRYSARAYLHLMDALQRHYTSDQSVGAKTILEDFRLTCLDEFGPFAYAVLMEFGVEYTEDVGEMFSNLVEEKFVPPPEGKAALSFAGGYDFEKTFRAPYVRKAAH